MGRKSRRNDTNDVAVLNKPLEIFPTAIYARLSVENSGKDDGGAALATQIEICKQYIDERPYLQLVKVYQDNGFTGTTMTRPAFTEMWEDIKAGIIKAVVVRDLSRYSRNYIETGTHLERIFPQYDLRFISVKEDFDNFTVDGTAESLMIPLQSLINDPDLMGTKVGQTEGVDEYKNVERLMNMINDERVVSFRGGTTAEFLTCILSDIALSTNSSKTFTSNFKNIGQSIDTQRMSISGVDQDEEAVNLVKYQNAYNLASKMIQTLTEVYDRLILQTGV